MIHNIWNTFLYAPLLNALIIITSFIPGGDIGVAIIILTLLVKILLFPLTQKSIESQIKINALSPELKKIKESGDSKEEQAKKTFELYKKYNTNPFSGCLLLIIQIPIIFALYYVFLKGINLDGGMFYSFVNVPEHLNMNFLSLLDLSQKSLFLAILAGISQFFQAYYMPKTPMSDKKSDSFQDNLNRSLQTQMKYFFPVIIVLIAYRVSGAVALYWITGNIFAIGQQIYANMKHKKEVVPELASKI